MRIVLALAADVEDRIIGSLLDAGHELIARPAGSFELIAAIEGQSPEGAIVAAPVLTPTVLRVAGVAKVRVVALASSASDRAHLAELGLDEVVESSAGWEEIQSVLQGEPPSIARERAEAPARAGGRIVVVWGPAGSPGRTTTALSLAAELAARGERVALVDADSYGGTIAPSLGLLDEAPGFAAACRLAGADALDLAQLERIAQPYSVGSRIIPVLTGIGRPSRWTELSADRVTTALRRCRSWVDTVIVDVGFNLESDEEIVSEPTTCHTSVLTDETDRLIIMPRKRKLPDETHDWSLCAYKF
ncbi:ParA family protein [Naasia lichenicola]|uniref:ParA family protein n=1 Tax=Naasia lichenicola TaxID=2565933 RepID=A0A4S4FQ32_9MICO|nr:ParA family protein [Naasia lichenicola]THG30705.1 ParA family protein [Naasia lichenicola]THG31942.1 ParA family protein [Naasia lichenicola]